MSPLINSVRSLSLARLGSLFGASGSQSLFQFSRRMSSETSGVAHSASTGIPIGNVIAGSWDTNNRIRVVGAILAVTGAVGMLFDAFYRRATKQELNQAVEKLSTRFDAKFDKLEAKIDGLTNALLHTTQRDRIAVETENRELRRGIEGLKGKEAQT